jgi:hypothetical protein
LSCPIPDLGKGNAGIWYLIAEIDAGNAINDANRDDNISVSDPFWVGQVINVLTHGFGNRFSLMPDFMKVWYSMRVHFLTMAGAHPIKDSITTMVADWDSTDGWIQAFGLYLLRVLAINNNVIYWRVTRLGSQIES